MTTEPTVVAPAPVTPVRPTSNKGLIITVLVLAALALGISAVWFMRGTQVAHEPAAVRVIENGTAAWYLLSGDEMTLTLSEAPSWYQEASAALLSEGAVSPAVAGNGSVVALTSGGLETTDTAGARSYLIERENIEWSSSAVGADASAAVLYNSATNAFDVFSLDSVRPTVLSYEGSIAAPELFYGVGVLSEHRVLIRTSETQFDLYTVEGGAVSLVRSLTVGEGTTSFLSIPVAHAWTYGTPLTATGATSQASRSCTGSLVASLGGASGTGAMPSIQTMAWNYMGAQGGLPANYNNGSYCIQAVTTITTTGGDPGGGGNEVFNTESGIDRLTSLLIPTVHAIGGGGGTVTWDLVFTIHSGSGTTAASDSYSALTYAVTPSASLSAAPATVDQGSAALLTWSSTGAASCTGTGFATGGATSGSVSVTPNTTTTYSVTCGSASNSATVTVLTRPNLVLSAVGPSTATAGVATSLTATVQNSGVAAAGASTVQFERSSASSGTGATVVGSASIGALAVSGSASGSASYTFPTGTSYIRACADSGGAVNESNESDNCSAWTLVTVSGAAPATTVTATLAAAPTSLALGAGTTLTWSSTNATSCVGTGFATGGATSGSVTESPTSTTQYVISCAASSGTSASGSWEGDSWWTGGTQTAIYGEMIHDNGQQGNLCPDAAAGGGYSAWNEQFVRYPNNCGDAGCDLAYVTCYGVTGATGTTAKPPVFNGGTCFSSTDWGCRDTTYRRSSESVSSGTGIATDAETVTVTVTECSDGVSNDTDGLIDLNDPGCTDTTDTSESPNPVTATLTAPASVPYNTTATLTWTCTNSTSATLSTFGSVTPVSGGSRVTGALTANSNYTLTCSGPDGTANDSDAIAVTNPVAYIQATPERVNAGSTTVLGYSATGLTPSSSCTVSGPSGTLWTGASNASGVLATTTSTSPAITTQSIFRISCDGASATDNVIVNIVPAFEEF